MTSTEAAIVLRDGVESVELIFVHFGMSGGIGARWLDPGLWNRAPSPPAALWVSMGWGVRSMTSTVASIALRGYAEPVELIFCAFWHVWRNRGQMAGSEPLELGPITSRCSLDVCGVGGEVYDLYGGNHRVARRRRIGGADFLCILARLEE